MIVYRLRFERNNAEPTEKLLSATTVDNFKNNNSHGFKYDVGKLFGWHGYAPEPADEFDAVVERRNMHGMATALIALADNKINARIEYKDAWVSLEKLEVA